MVWVQWRTSKLIRELGHLAHEEKRREDEVERRDLPELSAEQELEPS